MFGKQAQSSQRAVNTGHIRCWTKRKYHRGFLYANTIIYRSYQGHDVRCHPTLRGAEVGQKYVKRRRRLVCQKLGETLGLEGRIIPGPKVVNKSRKVISYTVI